jgi:2-oxoglutarate dehydrogenase E2 component (dihydrolipoamide succinyltransferase)
MPINVDVPPLGESVTEAVLLRWIRNDGDAVKQDEPLAELETDKANVDLPSKAGGVLRHGAKAGDTVKVGQVIGRIDEGGAAASAAAPSEAKPAPAPASAAAPTAARPASAPAAATKPQDLSPAVRRLVDENKLDAAAIPATGPNGRLTKEDVEGYLASKSKPAAAAASQPAAPPAPIAAAAAATEAAKPANLGAPASADGIRRVPMSKLRKKIAERLVNAQHTAAILTTFNEVDMQAIFDLRAKYKEKFEKSHGIGLGFMSFFAKACALALRQFERVNASLEGEEIVYHDYVNLGIAVSTERGLAVPVLRNVDGMSFAKIEGEIKRLALAARDGKLGLQELSGSTFTITNGGVFGSMLSTPILNPPESGILGMHAITKRAVVVNDEIKIRPMMYVALSYDHRIVDGRESVSFLFRVKELLEDPSRLMLEV